MIDIHSHIQKKEDTYLIDELIADMDRFNIEKRVISDLRVDEIQKGIRAITHLVQQHSKRLIGCALLNPALHTCMEDVEYALSLPEIQMIEFNPYEHGYAPDTCPTLPAIFDKINSRKLPVKVFSGLGAKSLPQQWVAYVEAYPDIPFIFLHMGCFDYGYGCVDIVERYPNAYIETSNQYEMQILKRAFQNLPMHKVLFGTSYPERFTRNAIEVFDMFSLSKQQFQAFMHDNAKRLWE